MITFRLLTLMLVTLFLQNAQADLVSPEFEADEAIIAPEFFETVRQEDPIFPPQPQERNIASIGKETSSEDAAEWEGQLLVQKEIPYSYPMSRLYLQRQTIKELEKEEKTQQQ